MNQTEIIRFFDHAAHTWDEEMICSPEKVNKILDMAQVSEGNTILDVACGTGILIPWYLQRKVQSVTGIDISPEMVNICTRKFSESNVHIICGDVETLSFSEQFDRVMVYNAFPHFPNPAHLISVLSGLVAPGGTLTVAHGMSKEEIDKHHEGCARNVSRRLLSAEELSQIFSQYLTVTHSISDHTMYQVTGVKLQ